MFAGPVQDLIDELAKLPGIGPKSAQRLAFHVLTLDSASASRLANTIVSVKEKLSLCHRCFNFAEGPLCNLCNDPQRDASVLCVVEEPHDIEAVERTGEFKGYYHVLGGAINPMEGIEPDDLRISELLDRLRAEKVGEVIVVTNPNVEGEATALYLARLLKPLGVMLTRPASGLPVGGDLEYADEVTLGRALQGRKQL